MVPDALATWPATSAKNTSQLTPTTAAEKGEAEKGEAKKGEAKKAKLTQLFGPYVDTVIVLFLSKLQSRVLSTLYPELCAACESHLDPDVDGLCEVCLHSCEPIGAACPTCAKPSSAGRAISCATCTRQAPDIASCSAAYHYGGQLAVALKQLKYAKRSNIARTLRPLLQEQFSSTAKHCDLGIAVPLHWRRLRKRGFNQAQRLLLPLASESKLKVVRNILVRTRNTLAQARLNARDRATNLQSAFQVRGQLHRQRILLLDDIVTTGSTLRAAARALRDAGASEVHCFVVARAELRGS